MKATTPTTGHQRSAAERIAIFALAIVQVIVTFLPGLGLGEPIGDRSDGVRTAITPAGWAFSIWGLLYAGSFAYAVYQILPRQRDNPLLARIGWASAGAFAGNAAWALYAQFIGLSAGSALIILFTLTCLLSIYRAFADATGPFTRAEQILAVIPLSGLGAWLTAATIVNVAATLTYHGIEAGDAAPVIAATVVIVGGAIAGAAVWSGRGNPWYALVFLWALAGIYGAGGQDGDSRSLAVIVAALVVAGASVVRLTRKVDRGHWMAVAH